MDERSLALAQGLMTPRYIEAGLEALRANERVVRSVIAQRRCPDKGLPDGAIEQLMHQLALMDTNNFSAHVGAGEREGRVAAPLVARRHYGLSHGIGRSGDVTSDQPKAAGSSLLYQMTNHMMLDLLHCAGAASLESAIVIPMATGMTLALLLRSVAQQRVRELRAVSEEATTTTATTTATKTKTTEEEAIEEPRFVVWTRIDQKTALKCIEAAGLTPVVVPLRRAPAPRRPRQRHRDKQIVQHKEETEETGEGNLSYEDGDESYFLQAHVDDIAAAVDRVGGPSRVVCVLSTTSCFAPRLPDDLLATARLCHLLHIPHIVNNAYGVQSRAIMRRVDAAMRLGRVDALVQSGDKNFLVPVGGAVLSGTAEVVARAAALYAGRASASPSIDLFMTALSLGRAGFAALWERRYEVRERLATALRAFAAARGEILLADERNDVSFAVTMRTFGDAAAARALGARLFRGAVTGPRVIVPSSDETRICGIGFQNYGMHSSEYAPCPMLVMACGIGMTDEDVQGVMMRLEELWQVNAK